MRKLVVNIVEVTNLPSKLKDAKLSFTVTLKNSNSTTGPTGSLTSILPGENSVSPNKKKKRKSHEFSELYTFPGKNFL